MQSETNEIKKQQLQYYILLRIIQFTTTPKKHANAKILEPYL